MSSLYQLNAEMNDLVNNIEIDPETGEAKFDEARFAELQLSIEDKKEGILLALKNLIAEKTMVEAEADILDERVKKLEKQIDRLKEYAWYALGGEKFKTARCSASWKDSETVEISDKQKLPVQYLKTSTTVAPDKVAIKKAIKEGQTIEGATLKTNHNLQLK